MEFVDKALFRNVHEICDGVLVEDLVENFEVKFRACEVVAFFVEERWDEKLLYENEKAVFDVGESFGELVFAEFHVPFVEEISDDVVFPRDCDEILDHRDVNKLFGGEIVERFERFEHWLQAVLGFEQELKEHEQIGLDLFHVFFAIDNVKRLRRSVGVDRWYVSLE